MKFHRFIRENQCNFGEVYKKWKKCTSYTFEVSLKTNIDTAEILATGYSNIAYDSKEEVIVLNNVTTRITGKGKEGETPESDKYELKLLKLYVDDGLKLLMFHSANAVKLMNIKQADIEIDCKRGGRKKSAKKLSPPGIKKKKSAKKK